jgi:hypothetical protein
LTPPSLPIDPDALRVFAYDCIVDDGHVPSVAEIGAHFGATPADARDAVRRIGIGKTLLAHPESGEIWMAGPFSAARSPYRVTARGRAWWANCAWDMFGIVVLAGESADVEAVCTDCGVPMPMGVDARAGPHPDTQGIVHFLVPARRWYEDIAFT